MLETLKTVHVLQWLLVTVCLAIILIWHEALGPEYERAGNLVKHYSQQLGALEKQQELLAKNCRSVGIEEARRRIDEFAKALGGTARRRKAGNPRGPKPPVEIAGVESLVRVSMSWPKNDTALDSLPPIAEMVPRVAVVELGTVASALAKLEPHFIGLKGDLRRVSAQFDDSRGTVRWSSTFVITKRVPILRGRWGLIEASLVESGLEAELDSVIPENRPELANATLVIRAVEPITFLPATALETVFHEFATEHGKIQAQADADATPATFVPGTTEAQPAESSARVAAEPAIASAPPANASATDLASLHVLRELEEEWAAVRKMDLNQAEVFLEEAEDSEREILPSISLFGLPIDGDSFAKWAPAAIVFLLLSMSILLRHSRACLRQAKELGMPKDELLPVPNVPVDGHDATDAAVPVVRCPRHDVADACSAVHAAPPRKSRKRVTGSRPGAGVRSSSSFRSFSFGTHTSFDKACGRTHPPPLSRRRRNDRSRPNPDARSRHRAVWAAHRSTTCVTRCRAWSHTSRASRRRWSLYERSSRTQRASSWRCDTTWPRWSARSIELRRARRRSTTSVPASPRWTPR